MADQGAGLVEPAEQRPAQDVVDAAGGGEQGVVVPGVDDALARNDTGHYIQGPWVDTNPTHGGVITTSSYTDAPVGTTLCKSGITTRWTCGQITAKDETVTYSGWFHRRPVDALQFVWTDLHGIWPWQPGAHELARELARDHTVHSIDLPGFGGLPKPSRTLGVADMSAHLAVVLVPKTQTDDDRLGDVPGAAGLRRHDAARRRALRLTG